MVIADLNGDACPCGSGAIAVSCCSLSLSMINLKATSNPHETYLLEWVEKYSPPISQAFLGKTKKFGYRISKYLDTVLDVYQGQGHPLNDAGNTEIDEIFWYQKHNIALTLAGSYSLLAQGMFVQSGILLRTALESSFVLLETGSNLGVIQKLQENKYDASSVLKRMKRTVPPSIVKWYGYFSANFAHVASVHLAQYLPRACYPDNWVIVTGLQNVLRGVVSYHCLLERAYLDQVDSPWFWTENNGDVLFNEKSRIFDWAEAMGKEIVANLPIDNPPPGVQVSNRTTRLKI